MYLYKKIYNRNNNFNSNKIKIIQLYNVNRKKFIYIYHELVKKLMYNLLLGIKLTFVITTIMIIENKAKTNKQNN